MLKHPCMAQQALDSWRAITGKTVSLVTHAMDESQPWRGAWRDKSNIGAQPIVLYFGDDTQLHIRGAGRSHKVEVMFP